MDDSDENIVQIGKKTVSPPDPDRTLSVVPVFGKCWHSHFLVDEAMEAVECRDCHTKLSAVWVLSQLANKESRLAIKRDALIEKVTELKNRTRYKCGSCGAMNNVSVKLKFRGR